MSVCLSVCVCARLCSAYNYSYIYAYYDPDNDEPHPRQDHHHRHHHWCCLGVTVYEPKVELGALEGHVVLLLMSTCVVMMMSCYHCRLTMLLSQSFYNIHPFMASFKLLKQAHLCFPVQHVATTFG